ncbi:MAG TPA: XRE family transcriptional regulator [Elusimicrobia bacterium]|nr:XRE family transcriptional regulator [Elusimicrobiota bacterium]HBT62257.1 XRE family transcriptional regulator [Elusimicrobiota bacterium]
MSTKKRRHVRLKDFLREELKDPAIRRFYHEARAEWLAAQAVMKARAAAHLTQAQLARRIHTSQQAISRIEAGEQNTTVEILQKIGRALGMELRIAYKPRSLRLKHA